MWDIRPHVAPCGCARPEEVPLPVGEFSQDARAASRCRNGRPLVSCHPQTNTVAAFSCTHRPSLKNHLEVVARPVVQHVISRLGAPALDMEVAHGRGGQVGGSGLQSRQKTRLKRPASLPMQPKLK